MLKLVTHTHMHAVEGKGRRSGQAGASVMGVVSLQ